MKIDNYKIFLASPDDTLEERKMTEVVVKELNETIGSRGGFNIELLKWENNTYPDFGEDGQSVINTQIGNDYQIFIGIMWKKFGTPTKRAGSGTEEEFERTYERYKQDGNPNIMFYFNSNPIPQDTDLEQFSKVKQFKKKISDLGGLYRSYQGPENFQNLLRKHLTNCILDLHKKGSSQELLKSSTDNLPLQISSDFEKYLIDFEVVFAHSNVDYLSLEDLYIAPDLRDLNQKQEKSYSIINLGVLSDAINVDGVKFMLIGNDVAGKTANSKYLFQKYFRLGLVPILLNGKEIKSNIRTDALKKLLTTKITEQYENQFSFSAYPKKDYVIIIDDFHKTSKGKFKYWTTLISNLESICPNIILTGNSIMPIESLNGQDPFKNFDIYAILEFGPKFRHELVFRWYTLGTEVRFLDQNELRRKVDAALSHIKTIIGKGYIPAYPFYLLSILQALETGNTQNQNLSIHGFYYEHLINDCFSKAVKDTKEISLFYNYLTYFCYYLFELQRTELAKEEFNEFHKAYCAKHDLSYSMENLLQTFDIAKLLTVNKTVNVKEKYIYYFFVAKFIANNINKSEIKELISKMSLRIFRDEYAAIIMFITHLSKDEFIIQELIKNANSIFPDTQICKLENDIKKINELTESIPEQVLELIDVEESRNAELNEQERNERLEKEFEKEAQAYDDFTLEDDIRDIDLYAKITLALKTIDILGQIAKKYWGELDGKQKLNLVNATYNLGLRTLGFYLELLQINSDNIVEYVKNLITEKHIKDRFALKQNIEETARNFIFRLCFLSSFGLTKRVSNSIGYDKLKNSFEKVLLQQPFNSVKLIDLSIKLGYSSIKSHIELIENYKKSMDNNKLSFLVLKILAIDHLYLFDTDYKTRTKLCQILKISVKEQLKIDATSTVKKKKTPRTTFRRD